MIGGRNTWGGVGGGFWIQAGQGASLFRRTSWTETWREWGWRRTHEGGSCQETLVRKRGGCTKNLEIFSRPRIKKQSENCLCRSSHHHHSNNLWAFSNFRQRCCYIGLGWFSFHCTENPVSHDSWFLSMGCCLSTCLTVICLEICTK